MAHDAAYKQMARSVTRYEDVAGVLEDHRFARQPLDAQDSEQWAKSP